MIDTLATVRSQGWDIHLHIVGEPENRRYYEHILQRVRGNASWIFLEENLSREALVELVSRHRYGIHGRTEEHFGIAVAELMRGGCLVFIPRGGGQVEIVEGDERLLYATAEEAAEKIIQVMSDWDLQQALRTHLSPKKDLFSTEQFMRRVQELVRDFGETQRHLLS
jgi:glycosyltransferase involved in cell wall biosynthesis